jgi:hypothetical protein
MRTHGTGCGGIADLVKALDFGLNCQVAFAISGPID